MIKPPSRLKNRGGGFMWAKNLAVLSYDKFCCEIDLAYDKRKAIMILR